MKVGGAFKFSLNFHSVQTILSLISGFSGMTRKLAQLLSNPGLSDFLQMDFGMSN